MLQKHLFIKEWFSFQGYHYHDGESVLTLYDVVLLQELPRSNLVPDRRFERVVWDFDYERVYIHYSNNKSCCILFGEFLKRKN